MSDDIKTVREALERIEKREKALAVLVRLLGGSGEEAWTFTDSPAVGGAVANAVKLLANRATSEQAAKARVLDRLLESHPIAPFHQPEIARMLAEETAGG